MVKFKTFLLEPILNNDEQFKKLTFKKQAYFLKKGIYGLKQATPESITNFINLYHRISELVEKEIQDLLIMQSANQQEVNTLNDLLECFYLSRVFGQGSFWLSRKTEKAKIYQQRWHSIALFLFHNSTQLLQVAEKILPAMNDFLVAAKKDLEKNHKKLSLCFKEAWEEFIFTNLEWLEETQRELAKAMSVLLNYNGLKASIYQNRIIIPVLRSMLCLECNNHKINNATIIQLINHFPKSLKINHLTAEEFAKMALFIMKWGNEYLKSNFKKLKFFQYDQILIDKLELVWLEDRVSICPQSLLQYRRTHLPLIKRFQQGKVLRYDFFQYERVFFYYGMNRLIEYLDKYMNDQLKSLNDFDKLGIIKVIKELERLNNKEKENIIHVAKRYIKPIVRKKTKNFINSYREFVEKLEEKIIDYKIQFLEEVILKLEKEKFLTRLEKVINADFIQQCRLLVTNLPDSAKLQDKFNKNSNVFLIYEKYINQKKSFAYIDNCYQAILSYLAPEIINSVEGINNIVQNKFYPNVDIYNQWIHHLFGSNQVRIENFEKNLIDKYLYFYLDHCSKPLETEMYNFYQDCFPLRAETYALELKKAYSKACQFLSIFFAQSSSYLNNNELLYVNGNLFTANITNSEKAAMDFIKINELKSKTIVLKKIELWINKCFSGSHHDLDQLILIIDESELFKLYAKKLLSYHLKNRNIAKLQDSLFFKKIIDNKEVEEIIDIVLNEYLLLNYLLFYEKDIDMFLNDFFPNLKLKYIEHIDHLRINELALAMESPFALNEVNNKLKNYLESSFPATKKGYESLVNVLQLQSMKLINPAVIGVVMDYLGNNIFYREFNEQYKRITRYKENLEIIYDIKNKKYEKAISKLEYLAILNNNEETIMIINQLMDKYLFNQYLPNSIIEKIKIDFFDKIKAKGINCISEINLNNYNAIFYFKNSMNNNVNAIINGETNSFFLVDENFFDLINDFIPNIIRLEIAKQIEPFLLFHSGMEEVNLIVQDIYHCLIDNFDPLNRIVFHWYNFHVNENIQDLKKSINDYLKTQPKPLSRVAEWINFYLNFYPKDFKVLTTKYFNKQLNFFNKKAQAKIVKQQGVKKPCL